MLDLLQKTFYFGLGSAVMTKNKAEELVKEAIAQAKLTPDEGKKFMDTLIEHGKKANDELSAKVEEILKTRGQSVLPGYKDLKAVEEKVQALEAKVAELESKLAEKA